MAVCFAAVVLQNFPLFAVGGEIRKDDVLQPLRAAVSRFKSIELDAAAHSVSSGSDGNTAGPIVEDVHVVVRRRGPRAMVSIKAKTLRPGKEPWLAQNDLIVSENGEVLAVQAKLDSSMHQVPGVGPGFGLSLYSKELTGKQSEDRESVFQYLNDAGAALLIIGYAPLEYYLDKSTNIDMTQNEPGATITLHCDYGSMTLELSPTHDWLPHSFVLAKATGEKTIGGVIGTESGGVVIDSVTWTGTVSEFKQDPTGHWFPKNIEVVRRTKYRSRAPGEIRTTINVGSAIFSPSLKPTDFKSDIIVPVGTPVAIMGASQLPYQWDGEKAIPAVPELGRPLANNTGSFEFSKIGSLRLALILINAVLVIALVTVVIIRRRAL